MHRYISLCRDIYIEKHTGLFINKELRTMFNEIMDFNGWVIDIQRPAGDIRRPASDIQRPANDIRRPAGDLMTLENELNGTHPNPSEYHI